MHFYKSLKSLIAHLIKVDVRQILILDGTPFSGSNARAFYQYLKSIGIEAKLISYPKASPSWTLSSLWEKIIFFRTLAKAKFILSTHGCFKLKKSQILIELWHGIPLKSMLLMDRTLDSESKNSANNPYYQNDYIISTSPMFNILLNACIGVDGNKYQITGYPRNDWLFSDQAKENLVKLSGMSLVNEKIVFYIPTFRRGYQDRVEGNLLSGKLFGFVEIDYNKFDCFLRDNKIRIFIKPHPMEEKIVSEELGRLNLECINILDTKQLESSYLDLYEVLGAADLLITDYSSVFFDFLLTEKPILFINSDIEQYRENRGFLLEPYDFWTPGPKVSSENQLKGEMLKCLSNKDYFKEQRDQFRMLFHNFNDNHSSQRVFELMKRCGFV